MLPEYLTSKIVIFDHEIEMLNLNENEKQLC